MSMLEVHKQARKNKVQVRFHEFKCTYKKDSKVIYGFCEGVDDLSFYRGPIESCLNDNWTIQLWEVGGVDNVVELFGKLDWRTYDKSQVIFFIDRDLTEFTDAKLPDERNVYITDNYSIENDVVNWNTCDRILTEILGFNALSIDEKREVRNVFEAELSSFIDQMVPVMSSIVSWRKKARKACLNDIYMKHLFEIKKGRLKSVSRPKQCQDVIEYIHKQCDLVVDADYDMAEGCVDFCTNSRHMKFTRGKYLLWFLAEFCLSVHRDCLQMPIIQSVASQPKNSASFSHSSAVILISSRFRTPVSLKGFLSHTVEVYVTQKEAA